MASGRLSRRGGSFYFQKDKMETIRKEIVMFAYAFILILLLPVAFLCSTIEGLFSPDELTQMGIRIRSSQPEEIG
jgi:hypothetical protein